MTYKRSFFVSPEGQRIAHQVSPWFDEEDVVLHLEEESAMNGKSVSVNALYYGALATSIVRMFFCEGKVWGNVDLRAPSVFSEEGAFNSDDALMHLRVFHAGCVCPNEFDHVVSAVALSEQFAGQLIERIGKLPPEDAELAGRLTVRARETHDPITLKHHYGMSFGKNTFCTWGGKCWLNGEPVHRRDVRKMSRLVLVGEESPSYYGMLKGQGNDVRWPRSNPRHARQAVLSALAVNALGTLNIDPKEVVRNIPILSLTSAPVQYSFSLGPVPSMQR